jgi:hypothetical protein
VFLQSQIINVLIPVKFNFANNSLASLVEGLAKCPLFKIKIASSLYFWLKAEANAFCLIK